MFLNIDWLNQFGSGIHVPHFELLKSADGLSNDLVLSEYLHN